MSSHHLSDLWWLFPVIAKRLWRLSSVGQKVCSRSDPGEFFAGRVYMTLMAQIADRSGVADVARIWRVAATFL